jgi:hypothetical protein
MPLSYNTDLQFPLLIDYYLSSGLINVGHLVHGILARHHTASIMSERSDYNLEVATIVLHFIMLIQCYLDTFLFASVTKFLIFLHIRRALECKLFRSRCNARANVLVLP